MKESMLKTIWEAPTYLPYVQPPLTDETLRMACERIGYELPTEYINLLRTQNGGYIRYTIPGTPHSQIYGIGPYFPSLTDFNWADYVDYVKNELTGLVPFDGDGHWYICLDYRKNINDPEIAFIDTESDSQKKIADNFPAYLSMLELNTSNEYVIETTHPIAEVIKQIADILKINFEEPDYFAHGYPIYRSRFNDSWIWVSANEVPKGFVRQNDKRYNELKTLMEGTALRYPEIKSENLLISFSKDDERVIGLQKLRDKSFVLWPLWDIK